MNSLSSSSDDRLRAVQELSKALAANYRSGGFHLHPALQFSRPQDSRHDAVDHGITARVTQPVPKGTVLLVIPTGERINYENVVLLSSSERDIQLTTSRSSELNSPVVSLKAILQDIETRCKELLEGIQVEDITLMVLIMYLLSQQQQQHPPSSSTATATTTSTSKAGTCVHLIPSTWPRPRDIAAQFHWTDDELQELQGTYAEGLLKTKRDTQRQIVEHVLIPILEDAHVLHHFVVDAASDSHVSQSPTTTSAAAFWNTFEYAYHIAQSRCHDSLPGERTADIVPLIDLIDGLPEPSVDINVYLECNPWSAIVKNISDAPVVPPEGMDPSMICLAIYASRDLNATEQLLISYGKIAPAPFLYKYGMIPHQYITEPHLPVDVIHLGFPAALAPRANDAARIRGLRMHGYPTSPEEIEQTFWFTLGPEDLEPWSRPLQGGLGPNPPSYDQGEPIMMRNIRQYLIVAQLTPDEDIQHFIETERIRGEYQLQDIGRYMLQVIDYNLERVFNSHLTNDEEVESWKSNNPMVVEGSGTYQKKPTAQMARILYRDALAQWRHVLCRYYKIFSAADDSTVLRQVLNQGGPKAVSHPTSLTGGGCSVCGCTLHIQRCSRCRQVWYCSKNHQKSAWKFHKPLCLPVAMQPTMDVIVNDVANDGEEKMSYE